uniref:Lipoxygenase 2 n=1 Tax=Aegilops tauschii TaxID=37682 RepID=R7W8R1_AEGTA
MAVEDPTSPYKVRLLIKDYPYATDGMAIWHAIEGVRLLLLRNNTTVEEPNPEQWVVDYLVIYYTDDGVLLEDVEPQAWWMEVREVGHGDLKDAPWWPNMQTVAELVKACITIIWIGSALHAAVNFGQYPYSGFPPVHEGWWGRDISDAPQEGPMAPASVTASVPDKPTRISPDPQSPPSPEALRDAPPQQPPTSLFHHDLGGGGACDHSTPYSSYHPNKPSASRRPMPERGSDEYAELEKDPVKVFLRTITHPSQALIGISLIGVLSKHSSDELYLGQHDMPEWTSDATALEAFKQFGVRLEDIEKHVVAMNVNPQLKNRMGPAMFPCMLPYPNTSDHTGEAEGLTARGIPNSIST